MMAAAALRPGSRQREQKFLLSTLNFLILLLWWVYLYMYLVFPNEYVLMDQSVYNIYSSSFFVVEFAVLMAVLGGMALVAEGAWRKIYWQLFGASALYLLSYQWLNSALNRNEYYSGSIYDVPDYAAICWLILIAVRARHVPSERLGGTARERESDVSGFLAVLAVLSMPVIGLLVLYVVPAARQLRPYRVTVTLIGILRVAVCVLLRHMLMARDIASVARECLMLCEDQWRKSGSSVELNFASNLPRIPINEGRFKQVFVNLFTNAAQAVEQAPEKKIMVEGNLEAKKIVVRFSDTGPGFSDLDRVFDPFYTTKAVGQGTGLGLSMCYGTIKEHNGHIYAHNLEPHGAAVTIELPEIGR